jgi:hypothetical protein
MTPCALVGKYQLLEKYVSVFEEEKKLYYTEVGSTLLKNFGIHLPHYTASQPSRPQAWHS